MKKNFGIIAAVLFAGISSSAFAVNEKLNFTKEAEKIDAYAKEIADSNQEEQYCVLKFEYKELFARYDKLLNNVYQYLKSTKASKEFDVIKQQQRAWIKEKETNSKASASDVDDVQEKGYWLYKSYAEYTQKRCKELIELVVDDPDAKEENKSLVQSKYDQFLEELSYVERYDKAFCDDESLNQHDINAMACASFTKWNDLMKKLYEFIVSNANKEVKAKIEADQNTWETETDKKAFDEEKNWEGGSGVIMAVMGVRAEACQARCKVLFDDFKSYLIEGKNAPATSEVKPSETKTSVVGGTDKESFKKDYKDIVDFDNAREEKMINGANVTTNLNNAKESFAKWDKLLNDIYKYLKTTQSSEDFEIIKKAQREWIKNKENASKEILKSGKSADIEYSKVASEINFTRERVELLLEILDD